MNFGLSDQVRARAKRSYEVPALSRGRRQFSIPVKELLRELEADGFPTNHARQVCTALTSRKFLHENNVRIDAVDGPPSKNSPTVVVHYSAADSHVGNPPQGVKGGQTGFSEETPEEWAHRVTGKIAGILKDELAEYGGGEAFLRWVRGYDEEDAA
jgi:hypothetical protein